MGKSRIRILVPFRLITVLALMAILSASVFGESKRVQQWSTQFDKGRWEEYARGKGWSAAYDLALGHYYIPTVDPSSAWISSAAFLLTPEGAWLSKSMVASQTAKDSAWVESEYRKLLSATSIGFRIVGTTQYDVSPDSIQFFLRDSTGAAYTNPTVTWISKAQAISSEGRQYYITQGFADFNAPIDRLPPGQLRFSATHRFKNVRFDAEWIPSPVIQIDLGQSVQK